jgi:hypothetical protein
VRRTFPHPNRLVSPTRRQQIASRAPFSAFYFILVTFERCRTLPFRFIRSAIAILIITVEILYHGLAIFYTILSNFFPDADSRIKAGCDQSLATRMPIYTSNGALVTGGQRSQRREASSRVIRDDTNGTIS